MTQLFRWKWEKSEGPMLVQKNGAEVYSEQFLLWCRKTEGLTEEQWRKGFAGIEKLIDAQKAEGKEPYPPSYHDFVTLAKGISPGGGNATAYLEWDDPRRPENDPSHPGYVPKQPALPDMGTKERNQKANRSAMALFDDMFPKPPPPPAEDEVPVA